MAGISNGDLADLLATRAESETGFRQKAFKRAARAAFLWPEEASDLLAGARSLEELHSVGPFIGEQLRGWIEHPPARSAARDSLRRDFLTVAEARKILARDPTWSERLRGDLHMHTSWSDGSGAVADMAEAADLRGYEYIAITDHSKGLKIAGGIDESELLEQGVEIAATNARLRIAESKLTVLRSIEMNLNPRGEGDMDAAELAKLDLVLGSFHSALRLKEDQTERYLAALRNPDVHVLGHPRGRVYNYRVGLAADWPRVFAEAAKLNKAVEIDCYPDRQDLNVELLKLVATSGARVSLGTDAHHAWQMEFIELGVAAALKAKFLPTGSSTFCRYQICKHGSQNCAEIDNPPEHRAAYSVSCTFRTPEASRKLAGGGAQRNHRYPHQEDGVRPGWGGGEVRLKDFPCPCRGTCRVRRHPVVLSRCARSTTG